MAKLNDKLPTSQLTEILREKSAARADVEFDYIGRLEDLRSRVGGEVRFINQLFPEYTPHDEEFHLSRLFHVADTLIGRERYEGMNATELFVLACGLYTHDWGMAVSDAERSYVVSGVIPEGFSTSDFALLPDEHSRFNRYLKERRLDPEVVRSDGISNADWREYVRQTHAFRSGARARLYFRDTDSGIAEAVGRVAEGHWLDIEKLQDYQRFPPDFAVLRENINLAALAVYVRLVDLLDIGLDRTPYVIWKFVAPRDPRSQMEWSKHRALQPVICSPYLTGRIVLVDGSTSDHEVYAALEDLHRYCDKQLRECTDLLARLNDQRHLLDLYHIEWRVAARDFDPVLIQFEFDRDRVFEILSDEIYQGDSYVFLRELLQNSIDAIRTRREIFKKRVSGIITAFGLIRVEVEHGANRDVRVRWSDDGIGMDDYTVRNYLAVAGRSYYRSEEFENLGLALDPISKFGIGILSCFMAAEHIEIETHRDPYAFSPSDPLRIKIPSVTRQFRVEKCSRHDVEIGTTVTVHVDGSRLPKDSEQLDVTSYLKIVAGFVEFPILVTEHGKHTLILHPHSNIDPSHDLRFQSYDKIEVHRLSLDYPLEEAILPQDLDNARSELIVKSFDLREDLGLANYEGRISFLDLRDKHKYIAHEFTQRGIRVGSFKKKDGKIIRGETTWDEGWHQDIIISKSANPQPSHAIYRDGVLVSNIRLYTREYSERFYIHTSFPAPRQVINLISDSSPEIDISRSQLRTNETLWYAPVRQALHQALMEKLLSEIQGLEGKNLLRYVGLFISTYRLDEYFLRMLPHQELPVGVINSTGTIEIRTWKSFEHKPVRILPYALRSEHWQLYWSLYDGSEYSGLLANWAGEASLTVPGHYMPDIPTTTATDAARFYLEEYYYPAAVSFLEPPSETLPPLAQEIWYRASSQVSRSIDELANQAVDNPLDLSEQERYFLLLQIGYGSRMVFITFPDKAASLLRIGSNLFNISHPTANLLFRSMVWLFLAGKQAKRSDALVGGLRDAMQAMISEPGISNPANVSADNLQLYSAAYKVGLLKEPSPIVDVKPEDIWYMRDYDLRQLPDKKESFGQVIDL